MPRAIIIGDRGQDGRILWDQLASQGSTLVGIGRQSWRSNDTAWNFPADIAEPQQMLRLVAEFAPDQIYFLAANHRSSQDRTAEPAAELPLSWACHVLGLQNVLEAVRQSRLATRVFYASTSRIYGLGQLGVQDERSAIRPSCIYGITKAAGTMLAAHYRNTYGMFVCSGILFNHESVLRGRQFVSQRIAHGLAAIKAGAAHTLRLGDLESRTDWGYAPDYTRAMQLILHLDSPCDFVVASGATHSVREMVAAAAAALDLSWQQCVEESAGILQRSSQGLQGDPSLLRRETGWQPSVSFEQMMAILARAALDQVAANCG